MFNSDYDYLTSSGLLATTESTLDRRVKEPLLSEALVIVYFTLLRPTLPVPARPKRPTNSQNRQPSKARFYHHQSHAWPEDRQIAARQRVWTSQKANDDSEMERTGEGKNCMICCGVACDPGTSRTESTSTCRYSQAVTLLSPREWSVSNTRSCASHDADHRPPSYWEREISNVPMGINYSIDCMFKPTAVPCVIPPRGRDPLGLRSQSANEFPGPAVPAASMRHLSLPSNRTASPRPNTDANDALFNTLPCQVSARCKLPVSLLCPAQFLVEKVQKEEGPYHTTVPRNATASVIPTYRTQESHQVSIKRRPARFPCPTSSGGALFSPPLRSKMPHPTAPSEASGYFLNVSPRTQQQPDMHGNGSSLPGSSAQQKNPNYFNCSGMNIDSGEAENPHSIFAIRRALEVQQESIPMESKNREFTTTAETPSSGSACTLDACQTSDTATGESADCLPQPHERLVNTCPDRSRRETILEGSFLKQQCCVWVPVVTASATSPSRFPSRALLLHACKKLFMRVTRYPCSFTIELKHWVTLISRTPLIEIVQRIWVPVLATSQTALRYPDRGSAKATTRTCRRFAQRPLAKRDLIFLYMQKVKFAQPGANLHSEQRGLCFWTFWELICILSSLTRLVLRNRKLDSTQERMVEIEAYCEAGGRGPPRNATREIADRIRSAPPHLFISSGECSEIGTSSAQSVEMAAGSGILDFLNNSEAEAGVQPDTEDDMAMLDDRSPKRKTDSEKHSTADPCGQTFGSLGSSSGGGPRDRLKSKTTSNSRKTSSTSSPRSNDMAAKKQDNTSAGRQLGTICNRLDEKFCDSPVFVPWWPELDSAFRSLHPTERVTAVDSLLTTLLAEADRLYLDSL
ncbi:hypothetical protein BESB_040650 [Besnoitia besnoiti]|uniref:Uncharacterized protein n=1 Tax=Besnoitia besnoiti TaxID=94643 RepID=A0A2A9MNT8_BESBE|nr:hypothetical protein BESB_040650 [Besnoitia besnoiti]PFH37607.1 hypothetical protein BESB_040650 [Besnoitia besnoiti]